jgi:hypothetical protein
MGVGWRRLKPTSPMNRAIYPKQAREAVSSANGAMVQQQSHTTLEAPRSSDKNMCQRMELRSRTGTRRRQKICIFCYELLTKYEYSYHTVRQCTSAYLCFTHTSTRVYVREFPRGLN